MDYKLYNFGLCCRNLEKSIDFYEGLGCKVVKKINEDGYAVAFLYAGDQVILELNEIPLMIEEKYFTKRRGSINSVSLKVDNIYDAYKDIENKGLRVVWAPKENKGVYQFGLLDEECMLIKIFNFVDNDFFAMGDTDLQDKKEIELKAVCLLTNQYVETLNIYKDAFGLKEIDSNFHSGQARYAFYGNESFNNTGILIKEIPENLEGHVHDFPDRDIEFIKKYGNGYEHLTFKVFNKDKKGEEWVKDPDGNHIRLIYESVTGI
ncbi:MAG: VOC family protein [Clostridia bacterium]|nr:VOC family protein [Clostridia bacterium]